MKTWFISGASRGFGALVAERALAKGDVVATARNPKATSDRKSNPALANAGNLFRRVCTHKQANRLLKSLRRNYLALAANEREQVRIFLSEAAKESFGDAPHECSFRFMS